MRMDFLSWKVLPPIRNLSHSLFNRDALDADVFLWTVIRILGLCGDLIQHVESLRQLSEDRIGTVQMVATAHGGIRLPLLVRE